MATLSASRDSNAVGPHATARSSRRIHPCALTPRSRARLRSFISAPGPHPRRCRSGTRFARPALRPMALARCGGRRPGSVCICRPLPNKNPFDSRKQCRLESRAELTSTNMHRAKNSHKSKVQIETPIRVQRRISNAENQPGRDVDEGSMLFSTPGQWMSALAPSRKPIRRSMEVGSSNEEEEEKDHEEESRQEEGFEAQDEEEIRQEGREEESGQEEGGEE